MSQRGSYQTKQQEAVATLFHDREDSCLTADEACAALLADGRNVGKTTVYRAIAKLYAAGELRRYSPRERGEAASYQYNPCAHSHLHIRCVLCGAVEHLHCDEVEAFAAHLNRHHGFTLDEGQTVLYGCCEKCRATAGQETQK